MSILYSYVFGLSFVSLTELTREEKLTIRWGYVCQEKSYLYIYIYNMGKFFFMFHFLISKNRPSFQGNYHQSQSQVSSKVQIFLILLRSNPYISIQYIMDQHSGLLSHTSCVAYLDYISIIIVCGDCSLTLNMGRCWNLLESSPSRITLIELSHKLTRILFIILNYDFLI